MRHRLIDILKGDCLEKMRSLPDNSVDSIVTDPPYGLAFMGKRWDYDVPSVEIWKEVLRVLKPGGHLLSFGGTRTYHRMVVNTEDAGFEIRDQIQWIYGSGFPKSHNLKDEWQGWGTALKPANEPIVLARKPISEKTVAANVLKWGCGGLNIDESRILSDSMPRPCTNQNIKGNSYKSDNSEKEIDTQYNPSTQGRWPANVIFDEVAAEMLDKQSGPVRMVSDVGGVKQLERMRFSSGGVGKKKQKQTNVPEIRAGASRFFYVAKVSKRERNAGLEGMQNHHPTVKPIKLMQYLVKLITPPNGTVLDPFMGSGSTGVACVKIGFGFIGIEREKDYFEIARKRILTEGLDL